MPVYEYECQNCSCRFEVKQGFDDDPVAICPNCKGKVRRLFASVPIIFKGSGFYVTDNRKSWDSNRRDGDKPSVEEKKEPPKKE